MGRGEVPVGVNHVTAFVDMHGNLSFWVVAGWEDDFTGYVLDYGAYPDQKRPYFTLRDARPTLTSVMPGGGVEAAIYAGLETLTGQILGRAWRRDAGSVEQHKLAEPIEADRYLASKATAKKPNRGLRFNKLVPPGAD